MSPTYAAFTEAEYRDRLARARHALGEAGFDCCISVAPETHYYLAGYDTFVGVNSPQALIFTPGDDEPALVLRNVDLPLALESTWLGDLRTYYLYLEDAAAVIAAVAREKGLAGGRVAIEIKSCALSHALGLELSAALAPARIEDATELLGGLRLVKSAAEMAYVEAAAAYANAGLAAARDALRPGITEIELAGSIEGAMRAVGSDYWSIPTELSSGPRTPGGHAMPRERPIKPGDLVHVEYCGVHRRYHVGVVHTMALGEPAPRAREIYELTRQSLAAGIAAVGPGVPVPEVEEASLAPLRKAGLEDYAMMRFGYGLGVAYPPIWLETLQISRGFDQTLEPGMVFLLHACLELAEEGIGIIQGGTWTLEDSGLRQLTDGGDVPLEVVPT